MARPRPGPFHGRVYSAQRANRAHESSTNRHDGDRWHISVGQCSNNGEPDRRILMGYIDCDTHVIEPAQTWDYFDPDERRFRPMINDGYWTVEDHVVQRPGPLMRQWNGHVFPGCDL